MSPQPEAARQILEVEGIGVSLSGRQILDNVSFSVRAGNSPG